MKDFIVVEVGSTNTKSARYKDGVTTHLDFKNIRFKNNLKEFGHVIDNDIHSLADYINELKLLTSEVYVYGTSLLRSLSEVDFNDFNDKLESYCGCRVSLVTADDENAYTCIGVMNKMNYSGSIGIMIGGGGSTEFSIFKNNEKVYEKNLDFGAALLNEYYPDLINDYVTSNIKEIRNTLSSKVSLDDKVVDVLVLAGGDYLLSHTSSGYLLVHNEYSDSKDIPYMISSKDRNDYDNKYYYEVSLDKMKEITPNNPLWWNGTRSIMAFAAVYAEKLRAKNVVPTAINMLDGIIEKLLNEKE